MAQHSVLSASKADRWTRCPGSIALCEGLPDGGTSAAAREGTGLHALLDAALNNSVQLDNMVGYDWRFDDHGEDCSMVLTEEQVEVVQRVYDQVQALPGALFTEMRVGYGRAINQPDEEAFGTVDVAKLDGATLHVLDAKFGRNYVDHLGNRQMLLYGVGIVDSLEALGDEIETITLYVAQPRVDAKPRDGWTITRRELTNYVNVLQHQAKMVAQARDDYKHAMASGKGMDVWSDKYLSPSDEACRWCPAAAACPARHQIIDNTLASAIEVAALDEFENINQNALERLPSDILSEYLAKAELVELFIAACKKEVITRTAAEPGSVPGWKLILGRQGNRVWSDVDDVIESAQRAGLTEADIYNEPTVKTPAQMERSLVKVSSKAEAKALVDSLTVRSAPKPSLVPESQPGEPWTGGADADEFKVL